MAVKPTKPTVAWALVNPNGSLLLKDYRCPLYWLRKVAQGEQRAFPETRIVKVVVNELFK